MGEGKAAKKALARKPRFKGWKTTDEEEIELRRLRASTEQLRVEAFEPDIPFYGTYHVQSKGSERSYIVEIRSLMDHENSCECLDFRGNGLGTCKHIEAVLAKLRKGRKSRFKQAAEAGSPRVEIYLSRQGKPEVKIAWPSQSLPNARKLLDPFFSNSNTLLADPAKAVPSMQRALREAPKRTQRQVRIARDVEAWASNLRRCENRANTRQAFLEDVREGKRSVDLLKNPLYPYQQEGMLHLSFTERAMLADDMGLGKTIQALAACELLRQTRKIERVLIVCPASLKAEWEEQIVKFSSATPLIVTGTRARRLKLYHQSAFCYIVNYEQIRSDFSDINEIVAPDVVILDEAQRIKNWQTKTAKSVKQLSSPYAFVLTGTPLENRIDEIYSILEFLDPEIFGSLFRFNREFYRLDERGRPEGYKNLDELHRRIRPILLRRRKEEVEDQLPGRTVNTYFIPLHPEQKIRYDEYSTRVAQLLAITKHRPLTKEEGDRLLRYLACMRMLCDTPFILDPECRICPKLQELESILEEVLTEDHRKVLIFSEWERMLKLVRDLADEMGIEFAWHTGTVPQTRRRHEINRFKNDPECSLFLSTDSGSTGLNLQAASVVINLDLPWNPAKLEQRIARAWRKHQPRSVNVINLVSEDTIEHRMLSTLAQKQQLADGVLDGIGDLEAIKMPSGRKAFMERLQSIMGVVLKREAAPGKPKEEPFEAAADPFELLRDDLVSRLDERLLLMEARQDSHGNESLFIVVDGDPEQVKPLAARLLQENLSKRGEKPCSIDLIDRATYETIQRLIDSGTLKFGSQSARGLFRAEALGETRSRADHTMQRLKEAQEFFSKAERKLKMSCLLKEGGFPVEAIPPLSEAVETVLKSLLHVQEDREPQADALSLAKIESILVRDCCLPEDTSSVVARLREAANEPSNVDPDEASDLVDKATSLFDRAREAISKKAVM